MNSQTLLYPYSWENRAPTLADQIFFIPPYYENHQKFSFPEWRSLFGNDLPVKIEYCSGNGSWILEKSEKEPFYNWVAVEKRFDRARQIWHNAKRLSLKNLFIICGEALTFNRHYLPALAVEEAYINFPDPWPKTKHAKHRLMTAVFIHELHRILKEGKRIKLATDDPTTSRSIVSLFLSSKSFISEIPPPHYLTEWPGYGTSYFESLWKKLGKTIFYHEFINR